MDGSGGRRPAGSRLRTLTSRGESALLRSAGPLLAVTLVASWVLAVWFGWALVFASTPGAVLHAETGEPASFAARIYFAATTIATTGVGDLVPASDLWRPGSQPWTRP